MSEANQFELGAWQPLTFGGIAKFARAGTSRLAVVILLFAAINGAVSAWFFGTVWSPVVTEAILELPEKGAIHDGILNLIATPRILAHRPSLALAVDMDKTDTIGQIADFQICFSRSSFAAASLLGFMEFPYPTEWDIAMNKPELEPLWGAWRPFLLIMLGASYGLALVFIWTLLGLFYAPLAMLAALIWRRPLAWRQAWRMSIAALMPGALWMAVVVALYGLRQLNLIGLMVAFLLHIVAGWLFLLFSPACLKNPPADSPAALEAVSNPFKEEPPSKSGGRLGGQNPFQ